MPPPRLSRRPRAGAAAGFAPFPAHAPQTKGPSLSSPRCSRMRRRPARSSPSFGVLPRGDPARLAPHARPRPRGGRPGGCRRAGGGASLLPPPQRGLPALPPPRLPPRSAHASSPRPPLPPQWSAGWVTQQPPPALTALGRRGLPERSRSISRGAAAAPARLSEGSRPTTGGPGPEPEKG